MSDYGLSTLGGSAAQPTLGSGDAPAEALQQVHDVDAHAYRNLSNAATTNLSAMQQSHHEQLEEDDMTPVTGWSQMGPPMTNQTSVVPPPVATAITAPTPAEGSIQPQLVSAVMQPQPQPPPQRQQHHTSSAIMGEPIPANEAIGYGGSQLGGNPPPQAASAVKPATDFFGDAEAAGQSFWASFNA